MTNDNFWNDDRVKEFVRAITAIDQRTYLDNKITEFKASNTSTNEKDWEIVLGGSSLLDKHPWFPDNSHGGQSCMQMGCEIISVRRKRDGVVFSVGDEITHGKILKFTISEKYCYAHTDYSWYYIGQVSKAPKRTKMFTTEDGVDIFDDFALLSTVNASWAILIKTGLQCKMWIDEGRNDFKYFSSAFNAKEYITLNKPCLSVNDVKIISKLYGSTEDIRYIQTSLKELNQLAKKKLNIEG